MNQRRALIMLALALLLGLAAVALAARWLLHPAPSTGRRIIVAASDISLGQRLTPEMLKALDWPAENMPRGAVQDSARLVGRVLRSSVLRDEPLSEAKLAPAGTLGGLSALIAEGKRAITVRVNDVVGVAGFALPGNFVDILVNMQASASGGEQAISRIVLERILVLAVAQEVGRDETRPKVVNAVTLEVTPAQAESIDLARSIGTLSLVLRNQIDPQPGVTMGATRNTLLHIEAPPVSVAREAPVRPHASAPSTPSAANAARERRCIPVIAGTQRLEECL